MLFEDLFQFGTQMQNVRQSDFVTFILRNWLNSVVGGMRSELGLCHCGGISLLSRKGQRSQKISIFSTLNGTF